MRIRVGEHIAECIITDPSDCQCVVRFFADGNSMPRWERRFEVSTDTSSGFEKPALGVDRFRVRQGQIELAFYRYCRGPGGREPSRVVRLDLEGEVPESPQTRPVRSGVSKPIDAIAEAPSWSVLPITGPVALGALLHALDQGDSQAVGQMLNASPDPKLWSLASDRGAAPRDWASVSLSEWAFVPAGTTTVAMWVAREPVSIHAWVALLPGELGPVRASLPPLLRALEPADASARPLTSVGWHEALLYCDALSTASGLAPVGAHLRKAMRASGVLEAWDNAGSAPANYDDYARRSTGFRLPVLAEWTIYRGLAGRCGGCNGLGLGVDLEGRPELCDLCHGAGAHAARRVACAGHPPELSTFGEANEWGVFDTVGNVLEWTIHCPGAGRRRAIGGTWSPSPLALQSEGDSRVGLRPVRTAPM